VSVINSEIAFPKFKRGFGLLFEFTVLLNNLIETT